MTRPLTLSYGAKSSVKKQYRKYTRKNHTSQNIYSIAVMLLVFLASIGLGIPTLGYIMNVIFKINMSPSDIQQIIIQGGNNAQKILHTVDQSVGENATVLEIDTSWKGKKHKLLGIIEKHSKYVFCAHPIKNETEAVLTPIFQRINRICFNTAIIITDLAKNFIHLIPSIFTSAHHLLCRVHTKRIVNRQMASLRTTRSQKQRKISKIRAQIKTARYWMLRNRKKRYNNTYELKKKIKQKRHIAQIHGISLNSKAQAKVRKTRIPSAVKKCSESITKKSINIKMAKIQEIRQKTKQERLEKQQIKETQDLNRFIGQHLTVSKIKKLFWRLMDCIEPSQFQPLESRLKAAVGGKTDSVSKKISEWIADGLRMCPAKHFDPTPWLSTNEISTNSIENFFGKTRVVMDQMRGLGLTALYQSRFQILRCLWNLHGSLTHFNPEDSPARRLGYKGDCWGCLERICEGLEMLVWDEK